MTDLPNTPNNLSTTMYDALSRCRERGALIYRPGGWWTYPGCSDSTWKYQGYTSPTWSVTRGTINALIKRGLVQWSTPGKRVEPVPTADWAPKATTPKSLDGA